MFECAANWHGCGLAFEGFHLLPGFLFVLFFIGLKKGDHQEYGGHEKLGECQSVCCCLVK